VREGGGRRWKLGSREKSDKLLVSWTEAQMQLSRKETVTKSIQRM